MTGLPAQGVAVQGHPPIKVLGQGYGMRVIRGAFSDCCVMPLWGLSRES